MKDNKPVAPKNKTNWNIKANSVRVIKDGNQIGVLSLKDAMDYAIGLDLDLIEVSCSGSNSVCIVSDYGKFKYDQSIKEKKQKKNQIVNVIKEIQFKPNIEKHDIEVKLNKLKEFIADGKTVNLRMEFKGRDNAHKDRGLIIFKEILSLISDISDITQNPRLEGNKILAKIAPKTAEK